MHDIAQDGAARRRGGQAVALEAAVHHTGDLDRLRISPGRLRGRATTLTAAPAWASVVGFKILPSAIRPASSSIRGPSAAS